MTQPRKICPGTTYFITRRCSERRFLLCPDKVVERVMLFCIAVAAKLSGVEIHAYVVMSNHYHLVVTDKKAQLPRFMGWLNRHAAHCLKIHRNHDRDFWESCEKYSAIELATAEAIWDKLAYTVANPAAANLVECAERWPGLVSLPRPGLFKARSLPRPALYFRDEGPVSARAALTLTIPPAFRDGMTEAQYLQTWQRLVSEREALATRERGSQPVLGTRAIRATKATAKPKKTELRRQRNPSLAAVTKEALRQAARALKAFRDAHRQAYLCLKNRLGNDANADANTSRADTAPAICFPHGTWWWTRYGGQLVAPA